MQSMVDCMYRINFFRIQSFKCICCLCCTMAKVEQEPGVQCIAVTETDSPMRLCSVDWAG